MSSHRVVTKDYAENQFGGFMVCGINFGYSRQEEFLESQGGSSSPESPSFFSDQAVNKTQFRDRVLNWLSGWGLEFANQDGLEGVFERSFFQTNWLDSQTRSVDSDGVININKLVEESGSFLGLVRARRPSVIFFVGRDPMEAFNDIRLRDSVTLILGQRSGTPEVFVAEIPECRGRKWKMLFQTFGDTLVVGLPHTQTRGLTDAYMAALKPPAQLIQRLRSRKEADAHASLESGRAHDFGFGVDDPLFQQAKDVLPEGEECPISYLQRKFRLGHGRAGKLYEAILQTKE